MDKDVRRVTVRKLDHAGRQVLAYTGEVLRCENDTIVLRTTWEHPSLDLGHVVLENGSRWTEYFFAKQWYNIMEIYASDGQLQGWYCNITRPACITPGLASAGKARGEGEIAWEDLALDLWVAADGEMLVLDQDEFAALPLSPQDRESAQTALATLQTMVLQKMVPFDRGCDDG